ncbi:MAG: prenyltransferase/squalene oxidase repeat-containing protein [Planctomycetota bacterium]|jgi:hypothetical protein
MPGEKDFYKPYRNDPNLLGLLVRSRILKSQMPEDGKFVEILLSRLRRKQRHDGSVDGSVVETCQVLRRFSSLGVSSGKPEVQSAVGWLRTLIESGASIRRIGKSGIRLEGGAIPVTADDRRKYCVREMRVFERDTLGGRWPDSKPAFESAFALVSLELEALCRYDASAHSPAVASIVDLIKSLQLPDGSWPAPRERGRVASTVFALRALNCIEESVRQNAVSSALQFLSTHQAPSGHFMVRASAGSSKKSIGVVAEAYVVDAISRFPGGKSKEMLTRLGETLLVKRRADGTWGRGPDRYLPTWRIVSALTRAGIVKP